MQLPNTESPALDLHTSAEQTDWHLDPRFSDLDMLGQYIAVMSMKNPRMIGEIPQHLHQFRTWYKGVVLAVLREKGAEQLALSPQHRQKPTEYERARQEFSTVFHSATAFVGDDDVRRAASVFPLDPEQQAIMYRISNYGIPEQTFEGSPMSASLTHVQPLFGTQADRCDVCHIEETAAARITMSVGGIATVQSTVGDCARELLRDLHPQQIFQTLFQGRLVDTRGATLQRLKNVA